MKVLGISFGRKGHNCDIYAKHALLAAKEAGAEVKFVNTMDMEIGHCKGCGACSALRDRGKQIKCILKDDYLALENEILDADGIIVVAPVYSLAPTGQLLNFVGRFGAAHDLASAQVEQDKRIAEGAEELLDERIFKHPSIGYISVGGAHTQNWTSMGLPIMHLVGMSTGMNVVGQLDSFDNGERSNPTFDPEHLEKAAEVGRAVAEGACGSPKRDSVKFAGEDGICPVCHNKFISIFPNHSTTVECPICGIEGEVKIVDGKLEVEFSEDQQGRARGTLRGLREHHDEIHHMMEVLIPKLEANKDRMGELLAPYNNFENTY